MKRTLLFLGFIPLVLGAFAANAQTWTVKKGDTLWAISKQVGEPVSNLASDNGIKNPSKISVGEKLNVGGDQILGSATGGYNPVSAYISRTSQYITNSQATIPVSSTKDPAGNQIDLSQVTSASTTKIYLTLEPGLTNEEIVMCTGVTVSSWTNCTRGLSFQGGSELSSSTLAVPHNAGSQIIISNVGQFFNQYVSVNGTQTINDVKTFTSFPQVTSTAANPTLSNQLATKFYVDTVGAGGFSQNNVSSTLGLQYINPVGSACPSTSGCVGDNVSSTAGLGHDSTGKLYVKASTSTFGFDTSGNLTFNTGNPLTFTAPVTFLATTTVPYPTASTTAANMEYVDNQTVFGQATGTAGGAITAGQALYISSTSSSLIPTNSGIATSTFQFIGVAVNSVSSGSIVTFTKPGGVNCQQSGLTPGEFYYMNGTAGQISATPGTFYGRIGEALSASCLMVKFPDYINSGTISFGNVVAGQQTTTTVGFYPSHITLKASCVASGSFATNGGISIGDETNFAFGIGNSASGFQAGTNNTNAFAMNCLGAGQTNGSISSRSANGFIITINQNSGGASPFIEWQASSE